MRHPLRCAVVYVLFVVAIQQVCAQPDSPSQYLDAIPGARWGPGGPWANQESYAPRPKPPNWVDPEPSRWIWIGERDPHDYADRSVPYHDST